MTEMTTNTVAPAEAYELTYLYKGIVSAEADLEDELRRHKHEVESIECRLAASRLFLAQHREGLDVAKIRTALGAFKFYFHPSYPIRPLAERFARALAKGIWNPSDGGGSRMSNTTSRITEVEIEAAVYYLTNIERIEAAVKAVTEKTTT